MTSVNPFEPPTSQSTNPDPMGHKFSLASVVRSTMVICGALISGVCGMTGIMLVLSIDQIGLREPTVLDYVGVTVAVATIAASFIIPMILGPTLPMNVASADEGVQSREQQHRQIETASPDEPLPASLSPLVKRYQTTQLMKFAVLEGGGVVNAVLMLTNHSIWHLPCIVIAVSLMVIRFPTLAKFRQYLLAATDPRNQP